MNITDIAQLKYGDIYNGEIHYERAKTIRTNRGKSDTVISVPILEQTQQIINTWGNKDLNPNYYIFPILTIGMSAVEIKDMVHQPTHNINDHTKQIAMNLGIDKNVTTYVRKSTKIDPLTPALFKAKFVLRMGVKASGFSIDQQSLFQILANLSSCKTVYCYTLPISSIISCLHIFFFGMMQKAGSFMVPPVRVVMANKTNFILNQNAAVKSQIVFYTLIILMCPALFSCRSNDKKNVPANDMPAPAKDYKVLTLTPRLAKVNVDFPATIQGQQIIEIRPRIDGYVEAIYVQEGATVKKGQLLFRISNPQYEQDVITAAASIKSAEADVDAAKMQVVKVRPLVEKDIVSKYELESTQYTLKAKEASLAQAKATLANAKTNAGYTILRSPANGVIGTIPYKVGALVNSANTEPLTTLSNITNIYAYYSLNEKQLLQFFASTHGATIQDKVNNMAPATLLLADGSLYPEKGKIELASGLISTETGTATFKALYANPSGIIRSGASATVRIPTTIDTALVIPQSATYELQDKRLVYIAGKDNKVNSIAITVIPFDNGRYFIVTSGLKAGETVVLEGLVGLRDNTQINPKQTNVDSVYTDL